MELFEAIRNRRSIRAYEPRAVEEDKLDQIIEAARLAPSAGNLQGYEGVVVRDAAAQRALVKAALGQGFLAQAPVVLAVFASRRRSAAKYGSRGAALYCLQDATIACAYAQLAATALGLGTVWVGAFEDEAVRQVLCAPEDWQPVALLPIGYPAESPPATPRRSRSDLVREFQS